MITTEEIYELFLKYPFISTDSRNCTVGSLFFALKGENFNANQFAAQALENGCAYAFVDDKEYVLNEKTILVEDVLACLQDLAKYHRLQLKTTIIAITGTNGKTTTKELVASVLIEKYKVLYTEGNLNNHIGLPLTLLRLTKEHELAIVEMGANNMGEISFLSDIAKPDYGLITNIGRAHLEGFGSLENIIKTKGELYDFIGATKGKVFINIENEVLLSMAQGIELIKYGTNKESFVKGSVVSLSPFLKINWSLENSDVVYEIHTHLIGVYNLENILAAITIGSFLKVPPLEINKAIENYIPTNNRSQLQKTLKNTLIIDAYNANPTSMEMAILNLKALDVKEKKVVILGDMKELGNVSLEEHQKIVSLLEEINLDKIYLFGDEFSKVKIPSDFFTSNDFDECLKQIEKDKIEHSYVLIKGSRSMKMERVVEVL